MTTHITVEYPTTLTVVLNTEAEMRALGYKNYKGDRVSYKPVNRPQVIQVKQVARKVQEEFMSADDYEAELTAKCLEQTGMTPSAYQARFKKAWNE